MPPVNNIGHHEGYPRFPDHWGGLRHTHAIFQGVKRPVNDDGVDGDIFIYIVAPQHVYRFIADMVCVAKREPAPAGAVFAVYVKFDDEEKEIGRIVNWEWVVADPNEPQFPEKYNERYDTKVWTNG